MCRNGGGTGEKGGRDCPEQSVRGAGGRQAWPMQAVAPRPLVHVRIDAPAVVLEGHGRRGVGRGSCFQHMVEIGNVADGEAQDLDLGQLLVGRQRGQQAAQVAEGHVEGLDADALARCVRGAVLECRASSPPPFLAAEGQPPAGRSHTVR